MKRAEWHNKYVIVKNLSEKNDTKVDIVEHKKLGCKRIMKQIKKSSPSYRQFSNEVFLMKDLKHSNIPQIYDVEEDKIFLYVIEQYIEGKSFASICSKERLSEQSILCYAIQICEIIQYLHDQTTPILYLDLKPENIIVSEDKIYLVDFGSAVCLDEAEYGSIYGTPGFAAPEQYVKNKTIDQRTDIYGIGMLLYYMATGSSYEQEKPVNIDMIGSCSKGLKRIINRCLNRKPFMRFTDVKELTSNLILFLQKQKFNEKHGVKKTYEKSKIAVAGAQERIGTTHIALLLCSYLQQNYGSVLYVEKNNTEFLRQIWLRRRSIRKNGVFPYSDFFCGKDDIDQPMIHLSELEMKKYNKVIKDLGVLTNDNLEEFLNSDQKLLVLGGKEWEIHLSEQAISLCGDAKDVKYIFNFMDTESFHSITDSAGKHSCYRVPYEPNPLSVKAGSSIVLVFQDIFKQVVRKRK